VLLLISGASGAGKTSVREAIAGDLAPGVEAVELRHLEPVPAVPDMAWRQRMAERAVCLLDVAEDTQRERLPRRGDPEELLPHHVAFAAWLRSHARNPAHMPHVLTTGGWEEMVWSRLTTLQWQITVIDGSSMSVAEAGRAALQWVRDAISGRAPVFHRCR
jgi:hypothetical protein